MADEQAIEELELRQEIIAADTSSPLHLIREKELEISGQVLAAKRHGDETVAAARKRAAEIVAQAEHEGGLGARQREETIKAESTAEAQRLREDAERDVAAIGAFAESRRDAAIKLVMETVTRI